MKNNKKELFPIISEETFTILSQENCYHPKRIVICENATGFCFLQTEHGICQIMNQGVPVTKEDYLNMLKLKKETERQQEALNKTLYCRRKAYNLFNCFDRRERDYFAVNVRFDVYDEAIENIASIKSVKISGAKGKLREKYSLVISCRKENRDTLLRNFKYINNDSSDYRSAEYKTFDFVLPANAGEAIQYIEI